MKTSEKLKAAFEESGKSYLELEQLTGISRSSLQRYANDVTDKIPVDAVKVIAEKLNISAAYLMGWEDNNNIYGNHASNLEYLKDKPELLEMYNQIHENENLQILFDTAKDLTPQDLEKVLRYMKLVIDEEL